MEQEARDGLIVGNLTRKLLLGTECEWMSKKEGCLSEYFSPGGAFSICSFLGSGVSQLAHLKWFLWRGLHMLAYGCFVLEADLGLFEQCQ